MNQPVTLLDLVFYGVAALTVLSGAYAVFSRNIVRAVFSLMGTFFGVAILYGFLAADFVAVVQVLVYVGGILVLMLFAVMLSGNIETAADAILADTTDPALRDATRRWRMGAISTGDSACPFG